jgi:NAD(P)H-hydrate repair Nnr-like enzyme with NAD(P)H-hydrate dehydratase domain
METITKEFLKENFRISKPQDNKYSRGVLGFAVGSDKYPGAGVLASSAGVLSGAGMCRLVSSDKVLNLALSYRPEILIIDGKADVWVLGSGIDIYDENSKESLTVITEKIMEALDSGSPVVLDASSILLLAKILPLTLNFPSDNSNIIITPHIGELVNLLEAMEKNGLGYAESACGEAEFAKVGSGVVECGDVTGGEVEYGELRGDAECGDVRGGDADCGELRSGARTTTAELRDKIKSNPLKYTRFVCEVLGVTVLLKGNTTYIVNSSTEYKVEAETAWLSTAGSGDVLGGVIGSVLAQNLTPDSSDNLPGSSTGNQPGNSLGSSPDNPAGGRPGSSHPKQPPEFFANCAAIGAFIHSHAAHLYSPTGPTPPLEFAKLLPKAVADCVE